MGGEAVTPSVGKDRHPVFLAFAVVDLDLPPIKIDVLHPELQRLEQPQSRPISACDWGDADMFSEMTSRSRKARTALVPGSTPHSRQKERKRDTQKAYDFSVRAE
jgi:hypothetical protein